MKKRALVEMLRVLMVVPRPMRSRAGGITRVVGYFAGGLGKTKNNVQLILCPTRLTERKNLMQSTSLFALLIFIYHLAFSKADLVHLHVAPKGSTWRKMVFSRISILFRKSIILHLHGSGYDEYFAQLPDLKKRAIQKFFQGADGVLVLGKGWRAFALNELGVSADRVFVVNNGVPDPGVLCTHENRIPNIVFAGNVGHRKGVDVLIDALSKLPPDMRWKCTICGNGEVEEYRKFAEDKGLNEDRVSFLGWRPMEEIRIQMRQADIFVLPSRAENQPVAILEAMAIGLPVVSTNVGDIPNQVINKKTGLVLPSNDSSALSAALSDLIRHKELRIEMGLEGRKRYLEEFSIIANIEKTLAIYTQVLQQKSK